MNIEFYSPQGAFDLLVICTVTPPERGSRNRYGVQIEPDLEAQAEITSAKVVPTGHDEGVHEFSHRLWELGITAEELEEEAINRYYDLLEAQEEEPDPERCNYYAHGEYGH